MADAKSKSRTNKSPKRMQSRSFKDHDEALSIMPGNVISQRYRERPSDLHTKGCRRKSAQNRCQHFRNFDAQFSRPHFTFCEIDYDEQTLFFVFSIFCILFVFLFAFLTSFYTRQDYYPREYKQSSFFYCILEFNLIACNIRQPPILDYLA